MNEQLGESPENIQGETPMPEEEAEVADSSQSSEDILSEDLHTNIIKNNREITSFLGEIQKEMKQEGFDCGGALEKAWAMIKETENLERDNKGMISSGDMLNISTRLMLLKSLVSELGEFQRLQEQIKNSGEVEQEVKQEAVEKKKIIIPSEEPKKKEPKTQDIMQKFVVPRENIEEMESETPESKKNVPQKLEIPPEKKEKKEEDLNEQKIVDYLLRRASNLLSCKDALLTGKELSDAEKGFLQQEFQDVSTISKKKNLLEMIETREAKLIEMAEERARIASMGGVMSGLRLIDKGFNVAAGKMKVPATFNEGLGNLDEVVGNMCDIVHALKELNDMRKRDLPKELNDSLNKFEKGVSVKLEGDENIKWEKKDESTDAVKISGRDVDRVQREDTNGWFFLKRLLEMAGESNHFGAIKEADSKGKVSRSRESLGNGRYRFDIEWEDATKAKNVLIITVNLGVEGRGGFWERHDIRKKKDVQVTVEEYWEKVKKEDETKTKEREPEEVGDSEDEKGVGNDEKHLSDFLLSGIREGRPIIVKKEGGVVLRYFRAGGKVYCQRLLNTGSYGESTGPFNDENEKVTVGKDGIKDIYLKLNEQAERQKTEERELEEVGDIEDGGDEKNAEALRTFIIEGLGNNKYQDYLVNIAGSSLEGGASVIDALDTEFDLDDEAIRKFIETLASFAGKKPQEITVKEIRNVILENSSNETNELFGELWELNALASKQKQKESVSAEDEDLGKRLLEKIKNVAAKNMKNEQLKENEKKLAKVIFEECKKQLEEWESEEDASESEQKNIEEETAIEDHKTEETEAEEKDERIESLERLSGEKDVEEGCVYKIFANGNYEIRMKNGIIYVKTEGGFQEDTLDKDFLLVAGGRDATLPLAGTTILSNLKPKENELSPIPMRQTLFIGKVKKIEKQFEKNNDRK